jgi:hypothetical protein
MTCQRTLSMVNMTHHYQVKMGLCGHCLSSNSFLETERENTWFLYKKARVRGWRFSYRDTHSQTTFLCVLVQQLKAFLSLSADPPLTIF